MPVGAPNRGNEAAALAMSVSTELSRHLLYSPRKYNCSGQETNPPELALDFGEGTER